MGLKDLNRESEFTQKVRETMVHIANSVKDEPYILEMKQRIEKGDIEKNISIELNRISEMKKKIDKYPPTEMIWILVNYIFGHIDRLEKILEHDINSLPKGQIFYNSVKSFETLIHFNLDNGIIDKENLKEEIEIFKIGFPEDKAIKFSERALNNHHNNTKHGFPTININKFNPEKIYETYNNIVFKCSKECFYAWLVDGFYYNKTIDFILKGRRNFKSGNESYNYAQLRKFIETITCNKTLLKDAYYKTVFGLDLKTSSYKTSTVLNDTFKDLKLNKLK